MPEINWMTILESQQDEFIIKLKERMPAFTRSKYDFDETIHHLIRTNSNYPEIDSPYSSILCGFKPTDLLEPDTDIYLKDLFYIGGLKGYLKHFT